MTLSRLIETLLLRDLLSYLIPGLLSLLSITSLGLDRGHSLVFVEQLGRLAGPTGVAFVLGSIAYVVGYLLSTLLFYLRDALRPFRRPNIRKPHPEIIDQLGRTFGVWTREADLRHLASLCLQLVEIRSPDFYIEKIERRVTLRNFEVSLSGVFLVWTCALVVAIDWYAKFWALLPLMVTLLLLLSSRNLDAAIDRLAFSSFFTISKAEIDHRADVKD